MKLAKLLMLCDFGAYERSGASITGATYEKWEHGHLPHELLLSEKDLRAEARIVEEPIDYFGKKLRQLTAQSDPDLSAFTDDELAVIEGVLRRYGHESATQLRSLSHQELGWRLAGDREEIPYTTLFLAKQRPNDEDVRRGEELASLHGWD